VAAPALAAAATLLSGALLGLLGAARNRVRFRDERLWWAAGGMIGAAAATAAGVLAAHVIGLPPVSGARIAAALWCALSLSGSLATPALDASSHPVAGLASLALKWLQSPLLTTAGMAGALACRLAGRRLRLARGTLFIEAGPGGLALTLGGVVWAQSAFFDARGQVPEPWASHEALHARAVAALGEWGFYLAYAVGGLVAGTLRGAPWNAVDASGRGNPLEKTAYTPDGPAPGRVREG
jgi:hypothetical protein